MGIAGPGSIAAIDRSYYIKLQKVQINTGIEYLMLS